MTTYKGIKGFKVRTLASDPLATGIAGALWSSGGNLNSGRGLMGNGMGTQTAAAVVAGFSPPSTYFANTELYNGTSWTESGDLPTARYVGMAAGTQTAGLYAGGYSGSFPALGDTYYFNGTTWSDQSSSLNTPRDALRGTGVQTAAIAAGGISGPGTPADDETEIWNGSTWTEVNNLNTARYSHNIAGTSTDAIAGPGTQPPGYVAVVESWNGTSWSETTEINTARNNYGRTNYAAGGASTGALIFGGQSQPTGSPDSMAQTEYWNGTSWTELNDLGTGRGRVAGAGNTTGALAVGAYPSTNNSATEEFTAASITDQIQIEGQVYYNSTDNTLKLTKTVLGTGAWSSGGNLNQAKYGVAGAGIQTAALSAGGYAPPFTANTELYNGTSWTEVNNLNTARYYIGAAGSQTSAIATAGKNDPNIAKSENESWDGTSWTELNDVNTAKWQFGQAGTSTASLAASGTTNNTTTTNLTESWNGTSWSEITEVNVARFAGVMTGSQTQALFIGGEKGTPDSGGGSPYTNVGITEYWNGSTWTELADLNSARTQLGGSGTYTSSLVFGSTINTELWNGTSWTEVNNLAVAGYFRTGAGGNASTPNTTALAIGGNPNTSPPVSFNSTEEWTVPSSITNSTITTS